MSAESFYSSHDPIIEQLEVRSLALLLGNSQLIDEGEDVSIGDIDLEEFAGDRTTEIVTNTGRLFVTAYIDFMQSDNPIDDVQLGIIDVVNTEGLLPDCLELAIERKLFMHDAKAYYYTQELSLTDGKGFKKPASIPDHEKTEQNAGAPIMHRVAMAREMYRLKTTKQPIPIPELFIDDALHELEFAGCIDHLPVIE